MEEEHMFIMGIFEGTGQLIIPMGAPVKASQSAMESLYDVLNKARLTDKLKPGHYLAYDYAENHRVT